MNLTRTDVKTARGEIRAKWRSLDPVLLLVSLALSALGILAVYVAGADARETYAMNQAFGVALGVAAAVLAAPVLRRLVLRQQELHAGARGHLLEPLERRADRRRLSVRDDRDALDGPTSRLRR